MRTDVLQGRKCVHVRFKKEVHTAFRTKMFELGMSTQEVLEEFARLTAANDPRLIKVLDEFARNKVQCQIDELKRKRNQPVGEMDNDSLYDLINEGKT